MNEDITQKVFKEILSGIERARIKNEEISEETLAKKLSLPAEEVKELIAALVEKGNIRLERPLLLTEKGRKRLRVGLIGGVFDIIHAGHIATLREARDRCDLLVVVIARDKTVTALKGKEPINDEGLRREIVEALKPVDAAVLGDEVDYTKPLTHVDPDVIFLGYDQELPEQLEASNMGYVVERIKAHVKGANTSKMIEKIRGKGSS
ncbi:MAG: adenylyltransferase/cytidyltransferase family protein [Candidatus Geothermarchaeales archaeon]